MFKPVRPSLGGALVLAAVGAAAFVYTADTFAHGAPEFPISRELNCNRNPQLPACQAAIQYGGEQAIYDWNGVNQAFAGGNHKAVVPDLKLCAGGQEKFKGFDLARPDWAATPWSPGADGQYEFRWVATAAHRTQNFSFFLTRDGWNASGSPLRWSDLDQVAQLSGAQIVSTNTGYTMKLSLPKRTGRHVLYSIWQRSDSTEAFYGCSDVDFGGASTPAAVPSALKQIGQVSAAQDLPAKSQLRLRVFDKQGTDLESTSVTLSAATTKSAWLGQLASRVNLTSAYVKLGALQGGVVTVPASATVMDVYLQNPATAANYALDVTLPTAPPTSGTATSPATTSPSDTWIEGKTYTVGIIVIYQGKRYRCLQTHTAWNGAGWTPVAPAVAGILWKPV